MLRAAIILFVLSLVAAALGFGGLSASMAGFAKVAFYVFMILAIASFVIGLFRR
jgi:uncharacterized membrane protein YtjA (UPF0391 family)